MVIQWAGPVRDTLEACTSRPYIRCMKRVLCVCASGNIVGVLDNTWSVAEGHSIHVQTDQQLDYSANSYCFR